MAEYLEAYAVEGFDQPFGFRENINLSIYDPTYDAIRQVLSPKYRNLSNAEIDALLRGILGRMSPEEVEGFWDTVKNVAGQVGGALKQAAPVLLPVAGAALGTFIGGPAGTAIGSQLGRMGAQIISPQKPPTPPPIPAAPAAAPPGTAAPAAAPIPAGGTSAVGQLMSLIQNPALLKSLLGQVLGPAGQQSVPAGSQGAEVPFGAIMNALSSLAGKAAQEAAEAYPDEESVDSTAYLVDPNGNFLVDPANPDARAQRVLELLREDYLSEAFDPGAGSYDPVTEWLIEANLVE